MDEIGDGQKTSGARTAAETGVNVDVVGSTHASPKRIVGLKHIAHQFVQLFADGGTVEMKTQTGLDANLARARIDAGPGFVVPVEPLQRFHIVRFAVVRHRALLIERADLDAIHLWNFLNQTQILGIGVQAHELRERPQVGFPMGQRGGARRNAIDDTGPCSAQSDKHAGYNRRLSYFRC